MINVFASVLRWIFFPQHLIGIGLALAIVAVATGPLILARWMAVRRHNEQFEATGAYPFDLPAASDLERERAEFPMPDFAPLRLFDTDTAELVRLDPDGLPLSEADLSARTPSADFTVDREHLAEILQLEVTGEYVLNRRTWAEVDAAQAFVRDPLTALVLPPEHLVDEAGAPAMAAAFWALVDAERIAENGWQDGDSDFHFWTSELGTDWQDDGSSDLVLAGLAGVS